MKKAFLIVIAGLALQACGNDDHAKHGKNYAEENADLTPEQQQEKQLFDSVITVHDELMSYERSLMVNKDKADSIVKVTKGAVKDSATAVSQSLASADSAMNAWMHQFEPDYSAKSHDEAIAYLTDQQKQITKVDSMTKKAIKASWALISNHK